MKTFPLIFFVFIWLIPVNIHSQLSPLDFIERFDFINRPTAVTLSNYPFNPRPKSEVTVQIEGGTNSLNRVTSIDWFIDGEEKEEFRNKVSITTKTKELGNSLEVTAIVSATDFSVPVSSTVRILPMIFDLLWEGKTTVPIGYKGRPLVSPNSGVRIVAFIEYIDEEGRRYTSEDFSFLWEKDFFDTEQAISTNYYDLDKISYIDSPVEVFVRATSKDLKLNFEDSITIPFTRPRIIIYERHPIYGLVTDFSVPNNINITSDRVSLSAQPLFFSKAEDALGQLEYSWLSGSEVLQKGSNARDILVRKNESLSSVGVNVDLTSTNPNSVFQNANRKLIFKFE